MNPISADTLTNALRWRYATKIFDAEKKIPAPLWSALEESFRLTRSSLGLQPWHFIMITNDELRQRLRAHSWDQPQITDCSHLLVLAAKTDIDETEVNRWIDCIASTRGVTSESLSSYRDLMLGFLSPLSGADQNRTVIFRSKPE